jgi:Holliday junction resolvasome RuvABC endonuclease subunit
VRCLALDLSTHAGWVAFREPGDLIGQGTWLLPDGRRSGPRFVAFHEWLGRRVIEYRPDILAFEEPIRGIPGRQMGATTNMHTQKLLQGLATIAELVAAEHDIKRCIEVPTSTAKKKLAGHGRADKHQMKAAAVNAGVIVGDEHQADALAVAMCAYEHCGVFVRGYDGPLLASASRW